MTSKTFAFGYIRVSTDQQEQFGISLSNQESKIRKYCELNDLTLVHVFSDTMSGKSLERVGFQEMMSRLGEVSHVVVNNLSRISRKTLDVLNLIETFDKNSIGFHSVQETLSTSSLIGRFILRTLASLAEMERDQISERVKDALSKVREEKPLGATSYGSSPSFKDEKRIGFQVNEEESKILAEILELKEKGLNLREIKEYLEVRGVKTKRGCLEWRESVIFRIIKRNQKVPCLVQ